ncbi:PAS-domain containing protein [Roseovarius phycicola]|uniref:PAS-domain containing protein n=1 Tax=Roseovarius phycicola TaxID=3080976 RepID=A0ABZ2HFI9_9RHOB
MQYLSTPWLLIAILSASLIVVAILWYLNAAAHNFRVDAVRTNVEPLRLATFLFRDEKLSDSDCVLHKLPWSDDVEVSEWRHLRSWLGRRFGPLPTRLDDLSEGESREFPALDDKDRATLILSGLQDAQRVQLKDPSEQDPSGAHRARELETFVARFGAVLNETPCAIRVFDKVHETAWYNQSFMAFSEDQAELLVRAPLTTDKGKRVHLPAQHGQAETYLELNHLDREDFQVLYVNDVTQVVRAEKARREFIQTLTKTFANLTTGLAVFDQSQRLALFNPALLDLTGLNPAFLSGQPQLSEVFDRLRDSNMLPEPKNYGSWRNQMNAMIKSASEGLYIDDWSLPNGMTYRITGRPHPDGAVAFLFEDISDEVALTRRFRGQIDLRQAALDVVPHAIAITGPNNSILLCNRACSDFFGVDPESTFAEMGLRDFLSICEQKLPHVWFWDACEKAVLGRTELERVISCTEGQDYLCRIELLPGHSMNISISEKGNTRLHPPELQSATA